MDIDDFSTREKKLEQVNDRKSKNEILEFTKELAKYLAGAGGAGIIAKGISEVFTKNKDLTYCVISGVDENGEVYVVAQNGTGAGKHFKLEEMPSGITEGTILRERFGKFVIDEKATKKNINRLNIVEMKTQKLLKEYKTEGVDYLVTELGDDYVTLKNCKTGLEFPCSELGKDVFNVIHEGVMLTCKNGEYTVKDKLK